MLQSRSPSPDSPSQALREKSIRARRGQSMPLVPAVFQVMSPGTGSGQASPTASIRSSHSAHNNNNNNNPSGINTTHAGHTPPLHNMQQQQMVHPRPLPWAGIPPPQILQQRAAMEEEELEAQARREDKNIKMTDALLADLARASLQQQQQLQYSPNLIPKQYSPKQDAYDGNIKYSPKQQPTNTSPHLHAHSSHSPTSTRRNSSNNPNHSPTNPIQQHSHSQHSPNLSASNSGYFNASMSNLNLNTLPPGQVQQQQVRTPDRNKSLPVQELEEEVVMQVGGSEERASPRDTSSSRPTQQQQRHWSNTSAGSSLVRARSPLGRYDDGNIDVNNHIDDRELEGNRSRNRHLINTTTNNRRQPDVHDDDEHEHQYDGRHSRTEHRQDDSDEEMQARYVAEVSADDDGETLIEEADDVSADTLAQSEQHRDENENESEGHTPRSPSAAMLPNVSAFGAFSSGQPQQGYVREQQQPQSGRDQAGREKPQQNHHTREQVVREHQEQLQREHKRRNSSDQQASNSQQQQQQQTPANRSQHPATDHHATIRAKKHRAGYTDQLGLQVFDPGMFQGASSNPIPPVPANLNNVAPAINTNAHTGRQSVASSANFSEEEAAYAYYLQMFSRESRQQHQQAPESSTSDQAQHAPRPGAPIPPTPVSQAQDDARWRYTPAYSSEGGPDGLDGVPDFAPGELRRLLYGKRDENGNNGQFISPSPSIHANSPAPGSPLYPRAYSGSPYPYPYPFSHVQRGGGGNHMNYTVYPRGMVPQARGITPATTQSDDLEQQQQQQQQSVPIDNAALQAEMARQWQVYAMNNSHPQPEPQDALRMFQQQQHDAGMMSDSTLGTSPGIQVGYTPWALLHMNRTMGGIDMTSAGFDPRSLQSSPSHEPIPLETGPRLRRKEHLSFSGAPAAPVAPKRSVKKPHMRRKPPPRVDSTQPRETSPELESESESSTAGEEPHGISNALTATAANDSAVRWVIEDTTSPSLEETISVGASLEYEDDWIDDDGDAYGDEEDELLELSVHPTFVRDVGKRRRRWEARWGEVVRAFQALDRQTDATLVLLATPSPRNYPPPGKIPGSGSPHSDSSSLLSGSARNKRHHRALHFLASRSVRRDVELMDSLEIDTLRKSFAGVCERVAASTLPAGSPSPQLVAGPFIPPQRQLYSQINTTSANLTGPASDSTSAESLLSTLENLSPSSSNDELRQALNRALGAMGAMGAMYERREARWREELERVGEERGVVDVLLGRVLPKSGDEGKEDIALGNGNGEESSVILGRAI